MTRTILAAATAALVAATAAVPTAASAEDFKEIIGIGYGKTQTHARVNSITAWVKEAHEKRVDANYNAAFQMDMVCFEQSSGPAFGAFSSIGVEGNASDPWACEITAYAHVL